MKYKVTMVESRNGKTTTLTQEVIASNEEQIINFYGLDEPDIIDYKIEVVDYDLWRICFQSMGKCCKMPKRMEKRTICI